MEENVKLLLVLQLPSVRLLKSTCSITLNVNRYFLQRYIQFYLINILQKGSFIYFDLMQFTFSKLIYLADHKPRSMLLQLFSYAACVRSG